MGTAIGSIDHRFRPLLRIEVHSSGESFLTLLDTGFNGQLHCDPTTAKRLGIVPVNGPVQIELAGGVIGGAQIGYLNIVWLGERRKIEVLIADTMPDALPHRDGEPIALVGGALLAPSLVLLDYGAGTIEIEAQ